MVAKDLAQKNEKELQALAVELEQSLREFRFQVATRQLKKIHALRDTKRDRARVLSALRRLRAGRA